MEDPWNISLEFEAIKLALEGLGADELTGQYLSIIETAADVAKIDSASRISDGGDYTVVLNELNKILRSLKRSRLSATKLNNKLTALSKSTRVFIQVELSRTQGNQIDLDNSDWSNVKARTALEVSVGRAREWARQSSGPNRRENLEDFCRAVQLVYEQLTHKKPGVGRNDFGTYYPSQFERLFVPSLSLVMPNATISQAREIFRRANWRR
jgi:hypothetical protein